MDRDAAQLSALLDRMGRKGPAALSRDDLRDLPVLYRRVSSQLAEARAAGQQAVTLRPLELLLSRAHGVLYAPVPVGLGRATVDLVRSFPAAVRRAGRLLGLAAMLLCVGTLWGYGEVRRDPASAHVLLSATLEENAEGFVQGGPGRDGSPIYGAFYFTNNARVAFLAFALGALFGAGTVVLLLYNGVILGATLAVVVTGGGGRAFLSFVLPHSGIELFAIVVAAAGGLAMGQALLQPGWRRRGEALAQAARESVPLALGAALILVVAGLVEGWYSPLRLALPWKAAVGVALPVLLGIYLWPRSAKGTTLTRSAADRT